MKCEQDRACRFVMMKAFSQLVENREEKEYL
jgi:hypothetical protein